MTVRPISISAIEIGERMRTIDDAWVAALLTSIDQVGLQQPITVRTSNVSDTYFLVAGAHRLAAAERLGWEFIPAVISEMSDLEARLSEIDENLVRRELNPLDRAVFLAERKAIYEALHPETKKGAKNQHTTVLSDTMSFSESAAARLSLSKRAIERSVAIAKGLAPETRTAIAGTPLADKQADLIRLARAPADQQAKIVDLVTAGRAATVAEAAAQVAGNAPRKMTKAESELRRLQLAWRKAGRLARRDFLADLVEEGLIPASVLDGGGQ